ncbi:MAG: anti-sigma factor antagonist [Streptomycetaceae bacterium]|jgi:anti-sigma B factor antagonist|nr:anti-sigma factor antagonist [Streptomycetaceae bacterium]
MGYHLNIAAPVNPASFATSFLIQEEQEKGMNRMGALDPLLTQPCRVVRAIGELDLMTAPAFAADLRGPGDANPLPWLVVDLSEVSFMDCSALGELCAVRDRNEKRGGWTRVVYTHPSVELLFRAARLNALFPRYISVHEAQGGRAYVAPL